MPKLNPLSAFILPSCLIWLIIFAMPGCGDQKSVTEPGVPSVQGVWEGALHLSSAGDSITQNSLIRLELVQQDYRFEGYLLKIDPLFDGLGKTTVDTFLVHSGTVSGSSVSFRTSDPDEGGAGGGGTAFFQGELEGRRIQGSTQG
ncbi:MAG: hypothetical protein U9N45_00830, partial [Gemmatimonadota bacterium]|nr:hypothetical protein [Gemmatimonadota bacterium]